jgi:hypothetical protein
MLPHHLNFRTTIWVTLGISAFVLDGALTCGGDKDRPAPAIAAKSKPFAVHVDKSGRLQLCDLSFVAMAA